MKIRLIPETNTVAIQLPINKIDWPRSGWSIKRIIMADNKRKLNKYFIWESLNLSKVKTFAVNRIKKGFKSSIGCNLKKYRSNHLFAPLTSTPIIGTKTKRPKNNIKKGIIIFFSKEVSNAEMTNIIKIAKIENIKCFEKKK